MAEFFFDNNLKAKMDQFVNDVYEITKNYPKHEQYNVTSQLRRASLSVILNYIEGYARKTPKQFLNFLRISYASLQESKYLLKFSLKQNYMSQKDYDSVFSKADEIGAMLWTTIQKQ